MTCTLLFLALAAGCPANANDAMRADQDRAAVIETTPVPEPAAAGVLMLAGGALTLCRPKRDILKGGFATGW